MNTDTTPAVELADAIITRRREALERKITAYQRKNSILSDIGDCERQMCYSVLDWDKRPMHDADLQARFDAGKTWETQVSVELLSLGFDFQASQMPVQIKNRKDELIASGKIDGFILWDKKKIPVEIKTMNIHVFDQIQNVEDFQKKPYLRKYTRQLSLYMFGNNAEFGLFLVTNGLGAWKLLPLTLDLGECEALLQRLERVHESIKRKEYLPRIPYDQSICGKCPFSVQCLPDIMNKPADFIDNPELEADVTRHEELKPLASEYDGLHDKLKETFKGVEKAVVGTRWMILSVPSQRTTYDLPPEAEEEISAIKKAHAKKVPVTRMVIEDLDAKAKE
jgi:CRISPR/Cas system-associated exonuclease Cas4 (RecB family)